MRIFVFMIFMAYALTLSLTMCTFAQTSTPPNHYRLQVQVNDQTAPWQVTNPATEGDTFAEGDILRVPRDVDRVVVTFVGGQLELNLADIDTWDYAHVLGTRWQQTDTDTYTVHATVRHADDGWDNYANIFQVVPTDDNSQVSNGVRELLHPHDNEQPFTRSQRGVQARGQVRIEAADNVDGWGGSSIELTLAALTFPVSITWQLTLIDP